MHWPAFAGKTYDFIIFQDTIAKDGILYLVYHKNMLPTQVCVVGFYT